MSDPTKGPWKIVEKTDSKMISSWSIQMGDHSVSFFPYVYQYADEGKTCGGYVANAEMHANAQLIIEAGTVYREYQLRPFQMWKQIKELREALQGLDEAYCRAGSPLTRNERTEDRKRLIAARSALANTERKTA